MSKQKRKKKRPSNILLSFQFKEDKYNARYSGIGYNTCFVVGIKYNNMYNACYTSTYTSYTNITIVHKKIKCFQFI